ncbi:MAG TPA: histidine kinase [Bacteroidales bacterium]|nr:histidine kinase [Bacteroidales bacterium]
MRISHNLVEKLLHPAFLGLVIWVIILSFHPVRFDKFKITKTASEILHNNVTFYYFDLDNDGNSEKLMVDLADPGITKLIFFRGDRIIDQYNFRFQPVHILYNIYFADYNHDGFSECFLFTANDDSIFLNIVDPLGLRKVIINNRFIDFRNRARDSTNPPSINPAGMYNRKDGVSDLIFHIGSGFCLQPRNVYRYMIKEDSLLKSIRSGASITFSVLTDITGDIVPEIITGQIASGNLEFDFPFTDQYTWLMVYDINMKFLFEPLRLGEHPGFLNVVPVRKGNICNLAVLNTYSGADTTEKSFLHIFSPEGKELLRKPFFDYDKTNNYLLPGKYPAGGTFYLVRNCNGEIYEFDGELNVIKQKKMPEVEASHKPVVLDANGDGNPEYIFNGKGTRSIVITQENLEDAVVYRHNTPGFTVISRLQRKGFPPELYLHFTDHGDYIRFEKNKLFYFRYPFYAGIYLLIFGLLSLLSYLQKIRLDHRRQTELQIASLQMRAIKSQLDPHFTLNMLNSIGGLYATVKNRQKADYIFGKFAKLIRDTVISSDKVSVTISEEIEFVRNYIELERFRCDNRFDYSIDAEPSFDMNIEIPRMLIHTLAENAVKHGVKALPGGGMIKISLRKEGNDYLIEIENNCPGDADKEQTVNSTGKGLKLISEMIDLFYKLKKVSISYKVDDYISKEGERWRKVSVVVPGSRV